MTHRHLPAAALTRVRPRPGRGLLAVALLVNAAVLVVGTTVATFTGRDRVTQVDRAGVVTIELDATGKAVVAAASPALAAGDWFERPITVSSGSTEAGTDRIGVGSWTLATRDTASASPTGLAGALSVKVETCSVAWGGGPVAHTCAGTRDVVLTDTAVGFSDTKLGTLGEGQHHLLLTVKLASTASDALQGTSSTIEYTFAGVQRAGKAR